MSKVLGTYDEMLLVLQNELNKYANTGTMVEFSKKAGVPYNHLLGMKNNTAKKDLPQYLLKSLQALGYNVKYEKVFISVQDEE